MDLSQVLTHALYSVYTGTMETEFADLIQVTDAARIIGVAADTVRQFANAGKLPCQRVGGAGYRVFKRSDVEKFAKERNKRRGVKS